MGAVFFDLSMSLDGFITGPNIGSDNPLGDGGEQLHHWMFADKTAEQATTFEEQVFASAGAMVMGRHMLDLGLTPWGDNPTFHMPVYVVTHRPHEPIVKAGGTTYYFVTEGLPRALEHARVAAGDKDIVIGGGADIIQQCLAAGVVDEIRLTLVPVLLGGGTRLFDHLKPQDATTLSSHLGPNGVVHLRLRVVRA